MPTCAWILNSGKCNNYCHASTSKSKSPNINMHQPCWNISRRRLYGFGSYLNRPLAAIARTTHLHTEKRRQPPSSESASVGHRCRQLSNRRTSRSRPPQWKCRMRYCDWREQTTSWPQPGSSGVRKTRTERARPEHGQLVQYYPGIRARYLGTAPVRYANMRMCEVSNRSGKFNNQKWINCGY